MSCTRELLKHGALVIVVLVGLLMAGEARAASSPWMDSTLPPEQRANLLLNAMTLDEKITMVHGVSGPYVGDGAGIDRLGVPALHLSDGPAGVADGIQGVTALPAPILLAASWDPALARQYGRLIGQEARGKGVHISLGPMINLVRVPQGGRNFETFGEDPYLTSVLGAQHILGIQSQGVVANAKHFVCNDQESTRGNENTHVDDRTLNEIYFPPFLAAVHAGVGSICAAYNAVNGPWSAESPMLGSIIKGAWGFDGFIECDWGGNFDVYKAATNGLDMEMPADLRFGSPLKSGIQSGIVPLSQLDTMVRRILIPLFRFGIFDNPPTGTIASPVTGAEHAQIARDTAVQGMVLLKNADGLLPLDTNSIRSIAVAGSVASTSPIWVGGGSALVYLPYYNDPLAGITTRAGVGISVSYDQGDGGGSLQQAVQAARQADVAIVCVGQQTGEGIDRNGFGLPPDQDDLVSAVANANRHTIVIMYEGAGTLMPWLGQVEAVLLAWYPGQENGNAVASILFGDANPSGKLPLTFPVFSNQVPASLDWQYPGTNLEVFYAEGIFIGYRWYDASNAVPLFPFGSGMSYTTFEYSNLTVGHINAVGQIAIECDVRNTGARAGAEIAQLYLGFPAVACEPPKQLKGFKKTMIPPGATSHIVFNLNWEDLAYWDVNTRAWTVPLGNFQVMVGASSRDIRLNGTFPVTTAIPTSGAANRALFRQVTASSFSGTSSASGAVDGDSESSWSAESTNPQWVMLDLGTNVDLARIRLKWGNNYARSYEIQISNNGANWVSKFTTASGSGGTEDIILSGSARYIKMSVTQSAGAGDYSLAECEVYSPQAITTIPIMPDGVWIEDSLPTGAVTPLGSDPWLWVTNNPVPYSGSQADQSSSGSGFHQQYFSDATSTLTIHTNDALFAYVYLDPANPPSEIMLQWNDGSWEHRAFWGTDNISFGTPGTSSHREMGPLPVTGQWIRLSVPANLVNLEGAIVNGMAFTLYGGRAWWDRAGRTGSNLTAVNISLTQAGATLRWSASVGAVYRVNYKNSLSDPVWNNGSGDITGSNTTWIWVDVTAPGVSQRFYQVLQMQ
jgi:beta-glucosidase